MEAFFINGGEGVRITCISCPFIFYLSYCLISVTYIYLVSYNFISYHVYSILFVGEFVGEIMRYLLWLKV